MCLVWRCAWCLEHKWVKLHEYWIRNKIVQETVQEPFILMFRNMGKCQLNIFFNHLYMTELGYQSLFWLFKTFRSLQLLQCWTEIEVELRTSIILLTFLFICTYTKLKPKNSQQPRSDNQMIDWRQFVELRRNIMTICAAALTCRCHRFSAHKCRITLQAFSIDCVALFKQKRKL